MNNIAAKTLVQALQSTASDNKSITYINGKDDETIISNKDLQARAIRLLGYFQKQQVSSGSEIILFVDNNEQFVEAFWAAIFGNIVAVPLAIGASDMHYQKLINVFRKLNRPILYTTEHNLKRLEKYSIINGLEKEYQSIRSQTIVVVEHTNLTTDGIVYPVEPENTAFIQFSSGSTGYPKGVVLSHRNVMSNVRAILQGMNFRDDDISLSWMPLTHDMGIIGFLLAPLVGNAPIYLMPTELFVRRPMLWLQKVTEKRVTITSSPNFGYTHLLRRFKAKPGELDLSSVRLIFNGAEPVSAEICRNFANTLSPFGYSDNAMFPVYGLAEASLAVSFPQPDDTISSVFAKRTSLGLGQSVELQPEMTPDCLELVRLGSSIQDCEIRVASSDGAPLPENKIGHILIRGENVTSGYYGDEALNLQTFNIDGWLDTGDLGFFNQNQLLIAGREKDLIIINGQNYHPHDLENICSKIPGLELGKVVTLGVQSASDEGELLVVFVLFRGSMEDFIPYIKQVKQILARSAGIDVNQVVPVRAMPKTTSGKIQRYLLADQYICGDFKPIIDELNACLTPGVVTMETGADIEQVLLSICNSAIDDRNIGLDDNLFEIGASSMKLTQIHEQIESCFPGMLDLTDLFEYPTVKQLAVELEKKKQSGSR